MRQGTAPRNLGPRRGVERHARVALFTGDPMVIEDNRRPEL